MKVIMFRMKGIFQLTKKKTSPQVNPKLKKKEKKNKSLEQGLNLSGS
jgi:hypothetical protein